MEDPNRLDDLHIRWLIDYPPFNENITKTALAIPVGARGPDVPNQHVLPFKPECVHLISPTLSQHTLLLVISDRPFIDDTVGSRRRTHPGSDPSRRLSTAPGLDLREGVPMTGAMRQADSVGCWWLAALCWGAPPPGAAMGRRPSARATCSARRGLLAWPRSCVARIVAPSVWSLDVVPDPQSPLTTREWPGFTFTRDPATLMVDRKVGMATTLTRSYTDAGMTATSVHLVLGVASSVAGRRELQFEADAVNTGLNTPYETTLRVPERLLGSSARLWVAPRAPLSRQMCPWQFDVTVEARRTLALPGPEDTLEMEGVLLTAEGTPISDYDARVVLGGRLASNLARTDAAGKFVLRVQRSLAAQVPGPLAVELAPADGGPPRPTLLVEVPPGQVTLGTLRLPAYSPAVPLVVPVTEALTDRPVAGATVQMQTTLPGAVGGVARYIRTAQTGADGRATLPVLLPPASVAPGLNYLVKVVPPASAETSARCLPGYAVGPATDVPQVGPPVSLARKVVLQGILDPGQRRSGPGRDRAGHPAGDLFREECLGDLASPPAETRTSAQGAYRLLLDPGEYRMDFQPDRGTALPYHVEETVPLLADAVRNVQLAPPVVVEGQVTSPEGVALSKAEVRVFGAGAEAGSPLRGVATTGSDGRFRLVLPGTTGTQP